MKIIECPRDAMQGIDTFITTSDKVNYINQLLKVGFDTIDFGSFVSPKVVPQMRDTAEVLEQLNTGGSETKLLAIVANSRGAREACTFGSISYLGFPLSISETFQRRNTNMSISTALNSLEEIKNLCSKANKKLVTYISMGFGNPYGDPYNEEHVAAFVEILHVLGSDVISLADTTGVADAEQIHRLFTMLSGVYPSAEIGVHLHSTSDTAAAKIGSALQAGCRRLDGAIRGYGGCPMAVDKLVGNLPTETIVATAEEMGIETGIDHGELRKAIEMSGRIFPAQ
jgi:hydroxymethylglutaryl-CoA lyase